MIGAVRLGFQVLKIGALLESKAPFSSLAMLGLTHGSNKWCAFSASKSWSL